MGYRRDSKFFARTGNRLLRQKSAQVKPQRDWAPIIERELMRIKKTYESGGDWAPRKYWEKTDKLLWDATFGARAKAISAKTKRINTRDPSSTEATGKRGINWLQRIQKDLGPIEIKGKLLNASSSTGLSGDVNKLSQWTAQYEEAEAKFLEASKLDRRRRSARRKTILTSNLGQPTTYKKTLLGQ